MRPSAASDRRLDDTHFCSACMDHLTASDIDADVAFMPNGKPRDFGDGINRAFFCGVCIHRISADIRHSVCAVFHLMGIGIQPAVAFD